MLSIHHLRVLLTPYVPARSCCGVMQPDIDVTADSTVQPSLLENTDLWADGSGRVAGTCLSACLCPSGSVSLTSPVSLSFPVSLACFLSRSVSLSSPVSLACFLSRSVSLSSPVSLVVTSGRIISPIYPTSPNGFRLRSQCSECLCPGLHLASPTIL
ncbi:hypothetical protein CALVIDRAFT_234684 [Calocera viscosa TUFC12733]|uniref:Uncharacterized protein n=1 Tax=Calocera viscosa (strain TUFC12733) TaxID=1330018 RepID=A0A167K024_CALVF|nr:hypothetical protein CALVIDRAFT_234684 [Calocera viscosa TUFC12733]